MADTHIATAAHPMAKLKSPWTVSGVLILAVAVFDTAQTLPIVKTAIEALLSTLPYILFAVFLIAYLKAAGAETMIAKAFKGREGRTIVMAALFGGLVPFCSCEVIPFIAAMLALGAPISAVMAFWLASPLIDPPTLLITAKILGWDFAIAKAITAVSLGLMGGMVVFALTRSGAWTDVLKPNPAKSCGCGPAIPTGKPVWKFWTDAPRRAVFTNETTANFLFLLKWLALAYVLEALMLTYVPSSVIVSAVGGTGIGSIAIAALVGMPAYLNSYVAAPLLGGLIDQGMQQGAALAFMTAGAVSCIPAMAAVWSLVQPKVFATYVLLGLTGAILAGAIFQATL